MTSLTEDVPNAQPAEARLDRVSGNLRRAGKPNLPGASHPIAIEPYAERIVVRVAGQDIADSTSALTLGEAGYPPIHYIPRKDVDMTLLVRSKYSTYSPYKGKCTYYSIPVGGERCIDSVWSYEDPYPAVAEIKGYLAFHFLHVDYG
jgi:uncharacterized protein (DUF427 family)